MDTMEKTQRIGRTIPCPNCGESYSISYKRCPFCGGSSRKQGQENDARGAASRIDIPLDEEQAPTLTDIEQEQMVQAQTNQEQKNGDYPVPPAEFSADIDWTPELDDGIPPVVTERGGKRLAKKSGGGAKRVIAVILSLLLIGGAGYVVYTELVPIVKQYLENRKTAGNEGGDTTDQPKDEGNTDEPDAPTVKESSLRLLDLRVMMTQAGETRKLEAVYDGEGEMGTLKWESSDPLVVSVSSSGVITAIKPGSAVITARRGADIKADCDVTCLWDENAPAANLSLSLSDFTLRKSDPSPTVKVIGTTETVTWASDNTAVATVSEAGVVKYVAAGDAKITATVGGQTLTCIVRCK